MRSFLLILLFNPVALLSQSRLHATAFGGFSNYQGDLQSKPFTFDQSHAVFGLGLKYDVTPKLSVRTGFNYGSIAATDKKNKPSLQPRNLSFHSKIIEGNLLAEYTIFDLDEKMIAPYVFGGIGIFHFKPFAFDTLGNEISLQPLGTEGQGLSKYPSRKPYKLTQLALPFGGGIRFRITDDAVLGYEIGMRKLFTDYLDDVSTIYVDAIALVQTHGQKALEMSYRGGEVKDGDPSYPPEGYLRGGEKFKDWYYFTGLTLSIRINAAKGNFFQWTKGYRGRTSCPTRVL